MNYLFNGFENIILDEPLVKNNKLSIEKKSIMRRKSKWDDNKIIDGITKIKERICHFPTQTELIDMCRNDLVSAITKHGGLNKFRNLLGDKPLRAPNGSWNDDKIIIILTNIIDKINHFPIYQELINSGRSDLTHAITRNGGLNKFRKILGYELIRKEEGFWTENVIIEKLIKTKQDIGHFPTRKELIDMNQNDLYSAICRHSGILKFRKLLCDEPLRASKGYWTDETILEDITRIKANIGHFPTQIELSILRRADLSTAISQHGGLNKFRKLLGGKPLQKPKGYWTDDIIFRDLTKIKDEIGHFPTRYEIKILGHHDLLTAISQHSGINNFRGRMGYSLLKKPNGYWTDEIIVKDLSKIKEEIGHFLTNDELIDLGHGDLASQISVHGGYNKFRELLGEPPSLYQKYRSESASYTNKRGKSTENFVKSILQNWCNQNNYPEPTYYKKLSKGHILEFICNTNKTIGIDVTNTTTKYAVTRKYNHKSYHKYLDELWIVVFSDVFTNEDYRFWNSESPNNIRVMSIDTFLKELDYSLDEMTRCKIDKLCKCTFHTKEELKDMVI